MTDITQILCAVDFSEGSNRAVEYARWLAQAAKAPIELLHVYQIQMLVLPEGVVTSNADAVADLTTRAQEALEAYKTQLLRDDVRVTTRLCEGNPVQTILEEAERCGASILVLGTHGRGGFKRLVLGSVAEQVVRQATMPVLTVRLSG